YLACADLLKRVGCYENEIDFVGRKLAQAEEIFTRPAGSHVVIILFPAKRTPDRCGFLAGAPESVRASRSVNFFRRNRAESATRDGRDLQVQRAECARDGRMN